MASDRLTALAVKRLKEPGYHADGGGLYLRIGPGRRSWLFRYKVAARARWLGLGAEGDVTLAEAREAARQCRKQLAAGIDPLEARRAAVAAREALAGQTFEVVADRYVAAHQPGWRNEKHGAQWKATLKAYAYPVIGQRPVQAVTVANILAVLEPIWTTKPETASRVRGRIEAILDYATARHLRTGENPARWKSHLDHLLPPAQRSHESSIIQPSRMPISPPSWQSWPKVPAPARWRYALQS